MAKEVAVKTVTVKKTAAKRAAVKRTVSRAKSVPEKAAGAKPNASKTVRKTAAKPVAGKAARPAAKAAKPAARPVSEQKEKIRKPKLVRDSFTMPEAEYQVLSDVKKAFLKAGISVKKSELLRAGVALIKTMDQGKLNAVIAALPAIKAGRPKKDK